MKKSFAVGVALSAIVLSAGACGSKGSHAFDDGTAGTDGGAATGDDAPSLGPLTDAPPYDGDPKTCAHAAAARTYVGCEFWPTVLPNVVGEHFDFAVVVANAGDAPAHVVVERGGQMIAQADVAPNSAEKVFLPWVDALKRFVGKCDTDPSPPFDTSVRVANGAYHLTSSVPVTVFQFNPLEYGPKGGPVGKDWSTCTCIFGCHSYTNDASLVLPSTALTGNYRVTSHAGIDTADYKMPGYFSITGLEDGTMVLVKLGRGAYAIAGGGIPKSSPGDVLRFPIARGEVVQIVGTNTSDFAGTQVQADRPVEVFAGHPCIQLPNDRQACDHIEESVLPAEALGKKYVVARPTGPSGAAVGQIVRIFGNVDGTTLTYRPSAPAGAPSHIDAGDVVDLGIVGADFEVDGDKSFAVATFQLGNVMVDPGLSSRGDPSQSSVASIEQFRTRYVFLAPDDYDVSFADVVMPPGAHVTIDGAPVTQSATPIHAELSVVRIKLGAGNGGAHVLTSDVPVGLQVMGYGFATSYQFPGGLDLKGIAPPPVPIR